jgi:hypothetical protein
MNQILRCLAALFIGLVLLSPVRSEGAQAVAPEILELVLRDGSRLFGAVERQDDYEVVFRAESGAVITVRRADVVSLRPVRGRVRDGEFVRSDAHRTRLFFGPTARTLDAGSTSVGVFEFLMPFVQVGVTDRLSLGGGTPLVFGFDESERPFWVTPKFQVYRDDRAQAAIGVFHIFNVDGIGAGIAYGVGTFGSEDQAVTVGAGMAYANDSRGAVVMIGGETRPRGNLKLMTENYVWSNGHGIVSGGVRFIGERLSADVGLAAPWGVEGFVVFPVVNFVYVF